MPIPTKNYNVNTPSLFLSNESEFLNKDNLKNNLLQDINIMTYQQANLLIDQTDYIYTFSPSVSFTGSTSAFLEKIYINGNRELTTPSSGSNIIEFFTLTNGVLKTPSIKIDLNATEAVNKAAVIANGDISISGGDTGDRFKATDITKQLQLQFYQRDFLLLSRILGLDSPDSAQSDQIVIYSINAFDGLFPDTFNFNVGTDASICQMSLGFSSIFDGSDFSDVKQIPISLICQNSYQVGSGFSDPLVLVANSCVPIGQLSNLNDIKYVRVKFNEPTTGEALAFSNILNLCLLFKSL